MARFIFQSTLTDQQGHIISGGTVTVNLTGTSTAATIYAAESGGSAISGSQVITGSDGSYDFWIDNGDHTAAQKFRLILAGGTGFATRTIDDIVIVTNNNVIGTDTQAWDAQLDDIAALAVTDGNIIVGDGTNWVAESGATARTSLGLGSISTQASNSVSITGGSVTGITDVIVADGGTGKSSATAYTVQCGGTTSTAAHQSIAGVGTSGQFLTSNGAGALPTFQSAVANNKTIWTMAFHDASSIRVSRGAEWGTVELADGVTDRALGMFVLPDDFNSVVTLEFVWWADDADGNARFTFASAAAADGEGFAADTDSAAVATYAALTDIVNFTDLASSPDIINGLTLVAGDILAVGMTRVGADGDDTINDTCQAVGWILTYT